MRAVRLCARGSVASTTMEQPLDELAARDCRSLARGTELMWFAGGAVVAVGSTAPPEKRGSLRLAGESKAGRVAAAPSEHGAVT